MSDRKITAPKPHGDTEAYWATAAEGKLLVKWCTDCAKPHWYPRSACPHCLGTKTEWRGASGRGALYTWSTMNMGPAGQVTIAYVTLDEGVTMLTNMVDCDPKALVVGQAVRVVFKPSEGGPPVPMFTPA